MAKLDGPCTLRWTGTPINTSWASKTYDLSLYTCYLTAHGCYASKQSIAATPQNRIQGIVVHSTAGVNDGSTGQINPFVRRYVQPLKNNSYYELNSTDRKLLGNNSYEVLMNALGENINKNDWNNSTAGACVHAFLGKAKDGSMCVVNTLPYTYACWGCGLPKKPNFNYSPNGRIQFEICEEDVGTDKASAAYSQDAFVSAAMYCAYLCYRLNLNPSIAFNSKVNNEKVYRVGKEEKVYQTVGQDSQFLYSAIGNVGVLNNGVLDEDGLHRPNPSDMTVSSEHITDYYATYCDNAGNKIYPMRVSSASKAAASTWGDWYVPTIISHNEAAHIGLGSNHGDPDHWLKTVDNGQGQSLDMNWFRRLVAQIYNSGGCAVQTYIDEKLTFKVPNSEPTFLYNGNPASKGLEGRSIYNSSMYGMPTVGRTVVSSSTSSSNSSNKQSSSESGSAVLNGAQQVSNIDSDKFKNYAQGLVRIGKGYSKWVSASPTIKTDTEKSEIFAAKENCYYVAKYLSNISKYTSESMFLGGKNYYPSLKLAAVVGILANIAQEGAFMPMQWNNDVGQLGGGLIASRGYNISSDKVADYQRGALYQLVYYCNKFCAESLGESVPENIQGAPIVVGSALYKFLAKNYWQNDASLVSEAKSKGFTGEAAQLGLIAQCWFIFYYFNYKHRTAHDLSVSKYISNVYPCNYTCHTPIFGSNYFTEGMTIIEYINNLPNTLDGALEAAAAFCAVAEKPGNKTASESKNSIVSRQKTAAEIWNALS